MAIQRLDEPDFKRLIEVRKTALGQSGRRTLRSCFPNDQRTEASAVPCSPPSLRDPTTIHIRYRSLPIHSAAQGHKRDSCDYVFCQIPGSQLPPNTRAKEKAPFPGVTQVNLPPFIITPAAGGFSHSTVFSWIFLEAYKPFLLAAIARSEIRRRNGDSRKRPLPGRKT